MKAHQKKVRDNLAERDGHENLFGKWWEYIDLDLKKTEIKPISVATARTIINRYEWLGCMPAICMFQYGIYFEDNCGGVVVFSREYAENLGVWDKFGFTGKILILSRGACLHWTPKNTGSKLIMGAIEQLPEQYEVITATVDELAGEIGTIYQACNFHYIGVMSPEFADNPAVVIGGKLYTSMSLRHKFGTEDKKKLLERFPNAEIVQQKGKGRYFYFRKNKRVYQKSIQHLIKPYPKRGENE